MTLLEFTLSVGLLASGAALIVRAVVPQHWLLVKPWSCDLCMSWWSSLVMGAAAGFVTDTPPLVAAVAAVGGTTVSVAALKVINKIGEV